MKDIVYFAITDWNAMTQRCHHLAYELSRSNRVFYVNPCYYSAVGYLRDTLLRCRIRSSIMSMREVKSNLYIIDLPPIFPKGLEYPRIGSLNYELLLPLIRMRLNKMHVAHPVLWVSLPPDRALAGRLGEALVVYDCMDKYGAFYPRHVRQRIEAEEQALLSRCDLVFVSSKQLYDHCHQFNSHVYLVPNGVHEQFLKRPQSASELSALKVGIIGYVGTLGPWVDIELLEEIALAYPTLILVLIGPVMTDMRSLGQLPNVRILGERPYRELPAHIAQFDIALIPFRVNDLTRSVDPVKLYEYMALGKPVVSTRLPEVERFSGVLQIADTHQEFIREIARTLQGPETLSTQRRELAAANTWQHRASLVEELITKHYNV